MLHDFIAANAEELATRCRAKSAARAAPGAPPGVTEFGIPLLIDQLVATLRSERAGVPIAQPLELLATIGTSAGKHGAELLRSGFTVEQVVHDYGDLCQALTELAREKNVPISVDEFHTFNRCLDNATADAVTEFTRGRERATSDAHAVTMNERLGFLAHELRDQLNAAMLAFSAIKSGSVAAAGATGAILEASHVALRDLIDRSLADVRLTAGLQPQRELISIEQLVAQVRIPVAMEAASRKLPFTSTVERGLTVDADRQMLSSAVANLLQNALKFTLPDGRILLTARSIAERVVIDVSDGCGGLPVQRTEQLFQSFAQHGEDRTGLGFGLSISRRGVEANGGKLDVRDIPGTGCVFTIELPRAAAN